MIVRFINLRSLNKSDKKTYIRLEAFTFVSQNDSTTKYNIKIISDYSI